MVVWRDRVLGRTQKMIEECCPSRDYHVEHRDGYSALRFEPTAESGIGFVAIIGNEWVNLYAELVRVPDGEEAPPQRVALETHPPCSDYRRPDTVNDFLASVAAVLTHPTRFRQKKGWVFWSFYLEFFDGSEWRRIGAVHHLRWAFRVYFTEAMSGLD